MEFRAGINEVNSRIDKVVKKILKNAPLSFIYKMFRNKDVKVNNKKVDISYKLQENDLVTIYIKPDLLEEFSKAPEVDSENKALSKSHLKSFKFDIPIIYEDDNLMIVNKPRGLLVHGDEQDKKKTLLNMFLNYLIVKNEYDPSNNPTFTPCLVHRLDRNTSGIVLLAKTYQASVILQELIKEKDNLRKTYLTLVKGRVDQEGKIDLNLVKDSKTNLVKVAKKNDKLGKQAITLYKRKKLYSDTSLVEVELVTGRTHQIRAHFKAIDHPIVGDAKYGDFSLNKEFESFYNFKNQFLHAYKIEFKDVPSPLDYLSNRTFVAKLPENEEYILERLSKQV